MIWSITENELIPLKLKKCFPRTYTIDNGIVKG